MLSNVKNHQSIYLLQWVHSQKQHFVDEGVQVSNQEDTMIRTLEFILSDINPHYFDQIHIDSQDFMDRLEQYLHREHGKRIKSSYRQSLSNNIVQLVKLVCYFCTKCQNRNEYINRIFNLPALTQQFLMQELKILQMELENIMDAKQIFNRVEEIEQENQELRSKYMELSDSHMKLLNSYEQLQNQYSSTKKQLDRFQKDKQEVLAALDITTMKDYIEIYQVIKSENIELAKMLELSEEKQKASEENAVMLNEKLVGDCAVINQLNDQVIKLKSMYTNLKEQSSFNNRFSEKTPFEERLHKRHPLAYSSLNPNQSKEKKAMKGSLMSLMKEVETYNNSYSIVSEEEDEVECLRKYNNELMIKLQEMYSKYNGLYQQCGKLKEQNRYLGSQNKNYENRLENIGNVQEQFISKYLQKGRQVCSSLGRHRHESIIQRSVSLRKVEQAT